MEASLGFATAEFWENQSGGNLVPWTSWQEWDFVREGLFSSRPAAIAKALNRIRAWRGKGSLPVIVDITASIVEIQQKDIWFREAEVSNEVLSQEMLAMLYCMAIIRLVNGVVEKTRSSKNVSIAEAAEKINLPRVLIDIRHEGSHRHLPSLELLRLASIEALKWLKLYHWVPQKDAIGCRGDNIMDVRKEIEAKINDLAFMLTMKDTPKKRSSVTKEKGPKKQMRKAMKNLLRLYLSFPSEVVSLLSDYMMKVTDFSGMSGLHMIHAAGNVFDSWKPVITKLTKRDSSFILTLLEAVLNKIKNQDAFNHDTGHIYRDVSALFTWLVSFLEKSKSSDGQSSMVECLETSEICTRSRIMKLLRNCLLLATPDNRQLVGSALTLAHMTGNDSLSGKLKKLSKLNWSGSQTVDISVSGITLEQQENQVRRAAEKLEFIKCSNLKSQSLPAATNADFESDSKWAVAESWSQCVIGMLPQGFGSLDTPFNASLTDDQKIDKSLQPIESLEVKLHSNKRKHSEETADVLDVSDSKKLREAAEDLSSSSQVTPSDAIAFDAEVGGIKDHMLVNGIWKKIGEKQIRDIQSSVRILV